jgi:transketolase
LEGNTNKLEKRVIELSFKHNLSHIGSCLTVVNILDKIWKLKKKDDPFILSNGHAGVALYVILEAYEGQDAEVLLNENGIHPNRNVEKGIWCTTGSLGQGITVAVGMAIADKNRKVYCLMSDGECSEGSVWEALRIAGERKLENLNLAVVANGYSAYGKIDVELLDQRLNMFFPTMVFRTNIFGFPGWLQGLDSHYSKIDSKERYEEIMKC